MTEIRSTRLLQTLSVPGGGLVDGYVAPPPREETDHSVQASLIGVTMVSNMHGMRGVAVERNAAFDSELEDIRARVRAVEGAVDLEARSRQATFEALRTTLEEEFSAFEAALSHRIAEHYREESASLVPLRESLDEVQSATRTFYDGAMPAKASSFSSFHTAEAALRKEAISMQDTVSKAWEHNLSQRCERQQVLVAERQAAESSDRNAQILRLSKEEDDLVRLQQLGVWVAGWV
jgi:hypothetical protein